MEIQPGHVIEGKYRIVRLLGTGGMGAVYEGENVRIRRKVAIKLLHASVSSQADVVQRFEREAQAAGRIGSEHICEVLDLGVLPDNTRYMVMEYLEGENLSARVMRTGRLGPAQSTPLMIQVLDALAAAHAAGIIHRDLKPDNIWITPQKGGIKDFVKLLDFGVSKFSQLGGEESMSVTRAGSVVGTPYYMSPEQARGMSQVDQRTDIYAIGVVLYQITTGQVPYQAETFNELLFKIVLEAPPPPQTYAPDLDPEFAAIIARAMAREPAQRFQSCQEFKDALLSYQQRRGGKTPSNPPAPMTGVGGTMMLDPNLARSSPEAQGQGMNAPRAPSGANWAGGSSPNAGPPLAPQQSQSTVNAWGNASSPGAAKPSSRAGLWIAVIGAAVLLGAGGVAAVMLIGRGKAEPAVASAAPSATSESAASTAAPPPNATVAATSAPVETAAASATPSAEASVAASTAPLQPSSAPTARAASKLTTAPTAKPRATSSPVAKPKSPGSPDIGLGY